MTIRNAAESLKLEERRLRVSFERFTHDSVEAGDAEERGWIDEEGISFEPDEFDVEDGLDAVTLAARFLHEKGVEPSTSHGWSPGMWYTQYKAEEDIRTGEYENHSFHPAGFSDGEAMELAAAVHRMHEEARKRQSRGLRF
jgi:hypothetical protein